MKTRRGTTSAYRTSTVGRLPSSPIYPERIRRSAGSAFFMPLGTSAAILTLEYWLPALSKIFLGITEALLLIGLKSKHGEVRCLRIRWAACGKPRLLKTFGRASEGCGTPHIGLIGVPMANHLLQRTASPAAERQRCHCRQKERSTEV